MDSLFYSIFYYCDLRDSPELKWIRTKYIAYFFCSQKNGRTKLKVVFKINDAIKVDFLKRFSLFFVCQLKLILKDFNPISNITDFISIHNSLHC